MPGTGIGISPMLKLNYGVVPDPATIIPDIVHDWNPISGKVTLNSGNVSVLRDSVGSENLIQNIGANQPIWNASDANFGAKPSMTFDGVNDYLVNTTLSQSQPVTIYAVFKFNTISAGGIFGDNTNNYNQLFTSFRVNNPLSMYYPMLQQFAPIGIVTTPAYIGCCVFSGTPGVYKFIINNVDYTNLEPYGYPTNVPFSGFILGNEYGLYRPLDGAIARVIMCNAVHNNTQLSASYTALKNYYGL
jgi:hypothetical protein